MEQPKYLIDSNALIDYLGQKLPANGMKFMQDTVNAIPVVSVITKIEVLGFESTREAIVLFEDFFNISFVLSLSEDVVNQTINLRKQVQIKLPDAIIAATALVHNLSLITRNSKDFREVDGLRIVDPYQA